MSKLCRIALKLDVKWPGERHTGIFAVTRRCANDRDREIETAMALLPAYRAQ